MRINCVEWIEDLKVAVNNQFIVRSFDVFINLPRSYLKEKIIRTQTINTISIPTMFDLMFDHASS